jgi:hypothetical protein
MAVRIPRPAMVAGLVLSAANTGADTSAVMPAHTTSSSR